MSERAAHGAGERLSCLVNTFYALHLFYDVAPDYLTRRAPLREQHLGLIQQAYERGELVIAGALADPADGAVLVFRGPSPEPAEAFAKADPYVLNGLFGGPKGPFVNAECAGDPISKIKSSIRASLFHKPAAKNAQCSQK